VHEIKHDGYRLTARRDPIGILLLTRNGYQGGVHGFRIVARRWKSGRPFGSARLLFFARFRWWEQPGCLRGAVELALLLEGARPNFWGTPNNYRLPSIRAVWLNTISDVAFQGVGSGHSSIFS
jgi:hypothetical protein